MSLCGGANAKVMDEYMAELGVGWMSSKDWCFCFYFYGCG